MITDLGFIWGPAEVTRLFSDPKSGVTLQVKGKRGVVVIRVTPSGIVKIEETEHHTAPSQPSRLAPPSPSD